MASGKRNILNDSDSSALFKEWDDTVCPICMDFPHNAVLLICSSHDKGCRSYICRTSYRHSNCLDRFKKLKGKNAENLSALPILAPESHHDSISLSTGPVDLETQIQAGGHTPTGANSAPHVGVPGGDSNPDIEEQVTTLWGRPNYGNRNMEKSEEWSNLRCPLCRGSVLGCEVVEDARKYLNIKSRSCSRESCSFIGSYRELCRHARRVHPTVHPAGIDPLRQRKWRHLVNQREYNDIVNASQSAMPSAVLFGDYAIENGERLSVERERGGGSSEVGRWLIALLFCMIDSMDPRAELRSSRSRGLSRHQRASGSFSRCRYIWGENSLGFQDGENKEVEMLPSNNLVDHARPIQRRRKRPTRAQSELDQQ